MDPSQFVNVLQQQKKNLEAAGARKGQRATKKESRAQLEFNFLMLARGANKTEHHVRTTQINYAYPPSVTPLAKLKPITIPELRLETHHAGKVLVVRTFVRPIRLQSVMNAVEDQNLDVDQLAVYNGNPDVSPADVLPKGMVFAIKEPYYKAAASGGYVIRVDHPSDIFQLDSTDPLIPLALAPKLVELDVDTLKSKNAGNEAYKKQNYLSAVKSYTRGLTACAKQDATLRHDLYRNRSIANFFVGRFESAAEDAVAALYSDAAADSKHTKENVKAHYRAGRAFYLLQDFLKAEFHFSRLLKLAPDDKDGQDQLRRTKARLTESITGAYDFKSMSSSVRPSHKRLDHASFTGNVEVRSAGQNGRGLFANKEIKAGDIVFVEKAFSVAFESEKGRDMHIIMNLNTNTMRTGPHALLYYSLVQKTSDNPQQAKRLLELHDAGYTPKCSARIVDGATAIDTFQVATIMGLNCFGCANTTSADESGKKQSSDDKFSGSVGIWLTASCMNHACVANSRRSFIGDFMIVRANKDIPKDQEIFISYKFPEMDYAATQKQLKNWGFSCACRSCAAEAQAGKSNRKERQILVKKLSNFLNTHQNASCYVSDKVAISAAKKLYDKLDATYDRTAFAYVPRIPLVYLGSWLCGVYQHEKTIHKVIETAQMVLRDSGYIVDVKGRTLEIDSKYCFSDGTDTDAAMYAAHACYLLGNVEMGKQYEAFAKDRYLVMYGEMRNFEKRYGDSERRL